MPRPHASAVEGSAKVNVTSERRSHCYSVKFEATVRPSGVSLDLLHLEVEFWSWWLRCKRAAVAAGV